MRWDITEEPPRLKSSLQTYCRILVDLKIAMD